LEISLLDTQVETQKKTDINSQTGEILSASSEETKKNILGFITIYISQYLSLIGSQIVSFSVIWYLTSTTGSSLILSLF
jgi:hypothetical protein